MNSDVTCCQEAKDNTERESKGFLEYSPGTWRILLATAEFFLHTQILDT